MQARPESRAQGRALRHVSCMRGVTGSSSEWGETVPSLGPSGIPFHYTPLLNGDRLVGMAEAIGVLLV